MSTKGADLGQEAYQQGTDHSVVDLLHNLEGQPLYRLSKGTERDAGTALAIVELPTGEGLGLQVEMCSKSKTIHVFPEVTHYEAEAPPSRSAGLPMLNRKHKRVGWGGSRQPLSQSTHRASPDTPTAAFTI